MGLAGKLQGMDGGEVEKYYRDGRIKEIAQYCESDVINTYRVWLRYELFRGKLTKQSYEASEANLRKFLEQRNNATSQAVKAIESELILK
jgi:predicted PolB exonuclease-like 3'-5' exonuclease